MPDDIPLVLPDHDAPRIPLPDPATAEPAAQEIFARFKAERGNVPYMFRTMGLRPTIMQTASAHMDAVLKTGTVPQALKELCVVRVSRLNRCAY